MLSYRLHGRLVTSHGPFGFRSPFSDELVKPSMMFGRLWKLHHFPLLSGRLSGEKMTMVLVDSRTSQGKFDKNASSKWILPESFLFLLCEICQLAGQFTHIERLGQQWEVEVL